MSPQGPGERFIRVLREGSQGDPWGSGGSQGLGGVWGQVLAGAIMGWCRHQGIAVLGLCDEFLVRGRTHIQADGQHLLERGDNQGCLHRVPVPSALLLGAFLV